MSKIKICMELLELLKQQEDTISKQNKMIAELTNENLEKENMINELVQYEEHLY